MREATLRSHYACGPNTKTSSIPSSNQLSRKETTTDIVNPNNQGTS